MKSFPMLPLLFSLLLAEGIIGYQKEALAIPISQAPSNICVPVGQIVSVRGGVQLKRQLQGWKDYHSTDVGAVLCQGDLLKLSRGAKAIVQCNDLDRNLWTVPDGLSSSVDSQCYLPNEKIYRINGPIRPTRNPLTRTIPYIINPNNTWLLGARPKLRWLSVPGSTVYVVRVTGPGVDWVREVNATSITYPGEPPLKPVAGGYLLTVEAENGESASSTFGILAPNKAARVKAAIARLERQKLTSDAKYLALAEVYIGQGLVAEATELLEASVARGSQIAATYYTLGDLYAHLELFQLAEKNYLHAERLAAIGKDLEARAKAASRLAEVNWIVGSEEKAAYWSNQAQKGFQALRS